jgi:hypothetical protein
VVDHDDVIHSTTDDGAIGVTPSVAPPDLPFEIHILLRSLAIGLTDSCVNRRAF